MLFYLQHSAHGIRYFTAYHNLEVTTDNPTRLFILRLAGLSSPRRLSKLITPYTAFRRSLSYTLPSLPVSPLLKLPFAIPRMLVSPQILPAQLLPSVQSAQLSSMNLRVTFRMPITAAVRSNQTQSCYQMGASTEEKGLRCWRVSSI